MPQRKNPLALSTFEFPRKYYPLIAILVLAISSLACFNTELSLTVTEQDGTTGSLDVTFQQYLIPSYVEAAKAANDERAADFQAAGRDSGEPLLPTSRADISDAFEIGKYKDQGYSIQETETGFSASRTYSLEQDRVTEDWKVRVIQNPEHPEQIIYRVKVYIDLTDTDLQDLQQMRSEPLIPKQDPNNVGGDYSGGGGWMGDLLAVGSAIADVAEGQMAIEMHYAQKAIQNSQPMEYKVSVTLPGEIVIHKLDGNQAGNLVGNTVTLILTESDMAALSGKKLEFHVESILKDCNLACNEESQPHLIWDGNEEGTECKCVCEKGFEVIEGERACVNCDQVCSWSDPNMVTDLAACEINQCGCQCQAGYEINNAGTRCITTAEAEAEDNQRGADGGPSKTEIGEVVTGLLLGMEGSEVNQMPGWFLLTSGEREELLALVEALGIAVDRSQLAIDLGPELTTDQHLQQINEERNRLNQIADLAIAKAEEEIENRRRVQSVIIKEIGGLSSLGQHLVSLPSYIERLFQTPRQLATDYVKGQLTDAVKNRILQETHGGSPATIEAAAAELIKQIPTMATNGCVDDYYLYKNYFQEECKSGCNEDEANLAHKAALEKLQENLENRIYGSGRINWSKPGDAYDRAFWTLNKLGK